MELTVLSFIDTGALKRSLTSPVDQKLKIFNDGGDVGTLRGWEREVEMTGYVLHFQTQDPNVSPIDYRVCHSRFSAG